MKANKEVHDMSYFLKWMAGGVLAWGTTHTGITPLDLVKCRKQVDPNLYTSIGNGMKVVYQARGIQGLYLGWIPWLIGYSLQGLGKFGFY